MSVEQTESKRPSFGKRLLRAVRVVVRSVALMLLIALSIGLAVALYYGVPAFYRQYVRPVRENVTRLDDVEARLEGAGQQTTERLAALQTRLESLEVQSDTGKQTLTGLQAEHADVEAAQATLQAQLDRLDRQGQGDQETFTQLRTGLDSIASLQATQQARLESFSVQDQTDREIIAQLQEGLDTLAATWATQQPDVEAGLDASRAALAELQREVAALQSALENVVLAVDQNTQGIQTLSDEQRAAKEPLTERQREVELLRVIEAITRGRLSLVQDEPSLARQDIQAGRDMLAALLARVPADQVEALAEVLLRLDAALTNLADSSAVAAADLAEAWRLLVSGPSAATAIGTPTATIEVTPGGTPATVTATPTPALTASATPAATPRLTPTASPTLTGTPLPTPTTTTTPTPTP